MARARVRDDEAMTPRGKRSPEPDGGMDLFSFARAEGALRDDDDESAQDTLRPQRKAEKAETPAPEREILTVGELTRRIKGRLAELGRLSIEGEVSGIRRPGSGHVYFNLKDKDAVVSCAIWRSRVRQALGFDLEEGAKVVVHGALDVYAPRGNYSLIVERVERRGIGALLQQLEELKRELGALGWFERRRALPRMPRLIGVVTSRDGAAFQDFLRTRTLRWAGYPVRLAHTPVQGPGSAQEIAAAIRRLDASGVDVLVVCRGGGSLEDLWAFNERPVAEAIHEARVPVVSGVGHEVDVTLADFVADHRAHTPTDAATAVIPERAALEAELDRLSAYLAEAVDRRLTQAEERLERAANARVLRAPSWILDDRVRDLRLAGEALDRALVAVLERRGRSLSELGARLAAQGPGVRLERATSRLSTLGAELDRRVERHLERSEKRLELAGRALEAISPLAVLERGYSVTLHDGKLVRDAADVPVDGELVTQLGRGSVTSRVESTKPEPEP